MIKNGAEGESNPEFIRTDGSEVRPVPPGTALGATV